MQILKGPNDRVAKIWVDDLSTVESGALNQIRLMLELPGLYKHIAIMPDVHVGSGAVIGGVVALEKAIVPNLVGVDIGCGVCAYNTGLKYERHRMDKIFWRVWKSKIDRSIPVGFSRHEKPQIMTTKLREDLAASSLRQLQREVAPFQLGTLGGGNHFIEAAYDEEDRIWLTVHSGSRNIGLQIASHYNKLAQTLNERWHSKSPQGLAFLLLESREGTDYRQDLAWATDFALENRYLTLERMADAFYVSLCALPENAVLFSASAPVRDTAINIHHNFAALENHGGENVVIHRKGATRARAGEIGIIPGSMGSATYIVKGLGNTESYQSCSHGAGRTMSRREAKQTITEAGFAKSLEHTFTSPSTKLLDEAPGAYKDIEAVMANQQDLVEVMCVLKPIITIKGGAE